MVGILLSFILLIQGIPVQQGGTVTGVLRDGQGMPIAGVRMAAVARPDSIEETGGGAAMAGIAETDQQGRFTLENIPPGRYYIAAGRLDLQTYFPGTQIIADATAITIASGAAVSGINFALNNSSFGRSPIGGSGAVQTAAVPVQVRVENGAKLPASADGKFTSIRLQPSAGNSLILPIDGSAFRLSAGGDFRVEVENLPETYFVKSILYGTADVTKSTFRFTSANFPVPLNPGGAAGINFSSTPPSPIMITIGTTAPPPTAGVRVTGRTGSTSKRLIYMSGSPGILYTDGTFEFRGVPPGRHVIATANNSSMPLAAVVVVGNKDLDGIALKETPLLPENIRIPKEPLPAGEYEAGSIVPLTRVTGVVLEESTSEPIKEGDVLLKVGDVSRTLPIDQTGHFETISLLPGTYNIRLQIFGHATSGPTFTVEDKDLNLTLTSRRLY